MHSKYFVTFIDDHSRMCWVYLLKEKSDVHSVFVDFFHYVQNQFNSTIQILHSDNGTEYFNQPFNLFLKSHGIVHKSSCPNSPQQNGIAERKNRHLLEIARALMFTCHVPKYFWGDAILTATHLINRMPNRVLSYTSPLDTLRQTHVVSHLDQSLPLRVFGCTAYVHLHQTPSKFDPRSIKCIFLGYSNLQKGYKCYDPGSKHLFVSRDVTFLEHEPFYSQSFIQGESWSEFQPGIIPEPIPPPSPILVPSSPEKDWKDPSSMPPQTTMGDLNHDKQYDKVCSRRNKKVAEAIMPKVVPISDPLKSPENQNELDLLIAIRKNTRSCTKHPIQKYVAYTKLSQNYCHFVTNLDKVKIPTNVYEALEMPEWRSAVLDEMGALEKNHTWDITELPKGKKLVGCKWVFTPKYNVDGTLNKYKARLVAKGFTQTYGLDYNETFAPVAKLNTVRILISIAVNLDWPLHQLDIKNAFLNGELKEKVYMSLPPGFDKGTNQQVLKLNKSIYGLKQSPRAWFDRFSHVLKAEGYKQSLSDHTMFTLRRGDMITVLIVYVDDIILTGNDAQEISRIKLALNKKFEVKDLGNLKYFLGMEVARSKEGIHICQRKYILDLLKETGMLGCKPSKTPISSKKEKKGNKKPAKTEQEAARRMKQEKDEKPADMGRYQRLVGKLIYLSHTRPDIAFAVSVASQHMHSPKKKHMDAAYKILKYLKGTPGRGLYFKKTNLRTIEVYTDADWAGDQENSRSTSGYCTFVWGNLVTWQSQKQKVVAKSSAESELRALSQGVMEGMWLKRVLDEVHIQVETPIRLYCDNKAALSMALNPVQHGRTKHVDVDHHFIREKVEAGIICLSYVPTKLQLADILTKGLPEDTFEGFVCKLDMMSIYDPT